MKYIFLLSFLPALACASSYTIELSSDVTAPTAKEIVEPIDLDSAINEPLLESFKKVYPSKIEYLISQRPYGNLAQLIKDNPNWVLSKLYRTITVHYPAPVKKDFLSKAFSNDKFIENYNSVGTFSFSNNLFENTPAKSRLRATEKVQYQKIWELSEGMGYIGIADSGLEVKHPAFRAFNENGAYTGGNLLGGYYNIDFQESSKNKTDFNVDEGEAHPYQDKNCDYTDGILGNGKASAMHRGHGTHVSGIIGAKNGKAVGLCKNCGMSMMKISGIRNSFCTQLRSLDNIYGIRLRFSDTAVASAWTALAGSGVTAVNYSAGSPMDDDVTDYCKDSPNDAECKAIKLLEQHEVLLVAAAGNHRTRIQFPASDKRVLAIGGSNKGSYWNESPKEGGNIFDSTNKTNCPFYADYGSDAECGSNVSTGDVKIDVITQAKSVYSTFYTGFVHNNYVKCNDVSDGIPNDGYGLCTGTSMSTPQVTAMIQLMRSANPLLPVGDARPTLKGTAGVRNILNATASRSINKQGFNKYTGYGLPNPRLALEKILGVSNGKLMKTRLTPMFALTNHIQARDIVSSAVASHRDTPVSINHVYTPFPQVATAFLIANGAGYQSPPNAPLVNEFPKFWYENGLSFGNKDVSPRAYFYVFSTNNNPFTGNKNMTPLRRMVKMTGGRNDTYAISEKEIESFHRSGYDYAGIEGYILPICSPLPSCQPRGSIKLYRDESNSNHRLEATNTQPNSQSKLLGFVYYNQDSDEDGLIDGQEIILGTNPYENDSDGDGNSDSKEYPPAGVPQSDPARSNFRFHFQDSFEAN